MKFLSGRISTVSRVSRLAACSFCTFCLLLALVPVASPGERVAQGDLKASREFDAWMGSPADLNRGLELARGRAKEMRTLMERNPEEFIRQTIPVEKRDKLPREVQGLVEKRVRGKGFFGVYCAVPKPEEQGASHAGLRYEVQLDGKTYQGFVFGKWKNQRTVSNATIDGVILGDAIALGDSPAPSEQPVQDVIAYSPSLAGPNTLLYMIARFSDQSSDPIDEATALSQMGVVSTFWQNNSSGTVSLRGVLNSGQVMDIVQITLPQPSTYASTYNANFSQLLSDARAAASAKGYSYSSYNLDMLVTTGSGFSYAGRSWVGAQGCHVVQGYTSLRTSGHELGHNLGLYHANYWRTDSTSPFGKDTVPGGYVADSTESEWIEYGHYFSVMSAQYSGEMDDATKPFYSPAELAYLGWLSGAEVQSVSSSGTNRLYRLDARDTIGTPRGIRILTPATDYTGYGHYYWLAYRYAPWSTAQNWFRNGLQIDVCESGYGNDGAIMLDMTPYSKDQASPFYDPNSKPGSWWTIDNSDKIDGALVVGRSYDDNAAGIHITPIVTGNAGSNQEYIDVVINLGTFPNNQAPTLTRFTSSTNQIAPGQAVNFNVIASDPDGDSLAYAWDFDETQVWTASGLNSANATKSWSTPGQYRVLVTVSDMKGGVTTASQMITVGSPANTNQIWGRVLWGGQSVYGARISTTIGSTLYQAWTEADGSYLLSDLPTGSTCTLTCQKSGFTFTAQFANPLTVASNAYGKDFYANEPLPNSGTTYVISGTVLDPVSGVAGIEVRAGGMSTFTDAYGNYTLSNFINGTYTVSAKNPNWTFTPASRTVTINSANSSGNNFSRLGSYSISGTFSGVPAGNQDPAPTVYLSNGRWVAATRTSSGGSKYWVYTLNNVPAGQYSVSAKLSGYKIVPSGFSNPLTISGTTSGINFSGATASVSGPIYGRITHYGVPLTGVTVDARQGSTNIASAITDSDGCYRIENLSSGAYTVIPSLAGCSFSPASLTVNSVPAANQNFTATSPSTPPVISSVSANPSFVASAPGSTTLYVTASGAGPFTYSWDATNAPCPVMFSVNDSAAASNTTVAFTAPGRYVIRVRVVDANGLPATGSISVTVNASAGVMAIAPYKIQVAGNGTVAFSPNAWDALGNRITVNPTWSVSGGGTINSTGLFTGTIAGGPYKVTAVAGSLSATGFVWVTSSGTIPPNLAVTEVGNGTVAIRGTGIPGRTYMLQYIADLLNPNWQSLNSATADANGLVEFFDSPGGQQRFYRTVCP